jgi:hypothetical protein
MLTVELSQVFFINKEAADPNNDIKTHSQMPLVREPMLDRMYERLQIYRDGLRSRCRRFREISRARKTGWSGGRKGKKIRRWGRYPLNLGGQYLTEEAARHHPTGGDAMVVNRAQPNIMG